MNDIQAIKERLAARVSLENLIAESVTLTRRSGRPVGCCPFHGEKSPSFYVYDDHFHCFGCGAHGDIISFAQKKQGLSFKDALEWLCEKYGVDAPELKSRDKSAFRRAGTQSRILIAAQTQFTANLSQKAGQEARDYLFGRGFVPEDLNRFGFGYALNESQALFQHLRRQGFSQNDLDDVSLISVYQDRPLDFFRHRVMIPIRDTFGRIIAFAGRALAPEGQKYKNSRYDKAATLFALDRARRAMGVKSRAIVVEGYMDALQMHRSGFDETVACQGTALTAQHIRALKSATSMIYLLFDGDQAGQQAALRVLKESLNIPKLRFKVAMLPQGQDPDSFLRQFGADAMESILHRAQDLLSYCIDAAIRGHDASALPAIIRSEFVPWLSSLEDNIAISFLIEKIAQNTGVSAKEIRDELVRLQDGKRVQGATKAEPIPAPREKPQEASTLSALEFEFLAHVFFAKKDGLDFADTIDYLERELRIDPLWLQFARSAWAHKTEETSDSGDLDWVGTEVGWIDLVEQLEVKRPAFADVDRGKAIMRLKAIHEQKSLQNTLGALKQDLRVASASDPIYTSELLQRIAILNRDISAISTRIRTN